MKVITRIPLNEILKNNPFSVSRSEPVLVSTTSQPMRTLELRRNLRQMREKRRYTFTRDFLY